MGNEQRRQSLLGPYRALDLTDDKGFICGKILADLGADVIKIERPGGDPARSTGPFYHDIADPEKSLYWFALNAGKRGITLDLETSGGRDVFRHLVTRADFVVESFPPGYLDSLGLGYPTLSSLNRRLILTSITPFGQNGPYKDYKAPDLVVWALGGMLSTTGDPDRAPVRISFPHAYLHAGAEAAAATMIAYYHRETTGEGQWVDVAAQPCVEVTTAEITQIWDATRVRVRRSGGFRIRPSTGARLREVWPCRDGHVLFRVMGGKRGAGFMRALVQWMDGEGWCNDYLRNRKWEELDLGKVTQEEYSLAEEPIGKFLLTRTRAELYEGALKRRIQLFPINASQDLLESRQLEGRGFWTEVEHPELGASLRYPGAFVRLSETPCAIARRAPLIGEHNGEIYQAELGLSKEQLALLKQAGVI